MQGLYILDSKSVIVVSQGPWWKGGSPSLGQVVGDGSGYAGKCTAGYNPAVHIAISYPHRHSGLEPGHLGDQHGSLSCKKIRLKITFTTVREGFKNQISFAEFSGKGYPPPFALDN